MHNYLVVYMETLEQKLDHLSAEQFDFIKGLIDSKKIKEENVRSSFSFSAYPINTSRENYVPALFLRIYMGSQMVLTQCFVSTLEGDDRLSEEEAIARTSTAIVAIIPEELIPGIKERVVIEKIEKMERKGATNLQLGLMVKVQEKKGGRKMDGKIATMYEDGTVTVATVGGKTISVDQSLVSVPKGAVAALKAGR